MQITIEQALYGAHGAGGYRFLARSREFLEEWLPEAERLCTGFGERRPGVSCPAAVFAQPFGRHTVAVVQVADQGADDTGRPGALAFHLLLLSRSDYQGLGGDPFAIAERTPPNWQARGELPTLTWPAEPLPPRTVEQVRRVLKREDGPGLLGAAQILVDGGHVAFEQSTPDPIVVRDLWTLLPNSTRGELWPASFAFGNALRFHALAVPPGARAAAPADFPHYATAEEAANYPEGRYELNLQTAVEADDQRSLDGLLARRSRSEMWRLGIIILILVLLAPILMHFIAPPLEPAPATTAPKPRPPTTQQTRLELPNDPSLDEAQRRRLVAQLEQVVRERGVRPADWVRGQPQLLANFGVAPVGFPGVLPWSGLYFAGHEAELLLAALDQHLGSPHAKLEPGPLYLLGPPQRQLRALLWKHGIAGADDQRLNAVELAEKLNQPLPSAGAVR